jgi:hypothetical protein
MSFKHRVLSSSSSAFTKLCQELSYWSGLVLLPRKPDWEAYGKQARLTGQFPQRLSAALCSSRPAAAFGQHRKSDEEWTFTRLR